MNAGEFDKRITVLKHTRDADGNYSLVPAYKRWAKTEETAENLSLIHISEPTRPY